MGCELEFFRWRGYEETARFQEELSKKIISEDKFRELRYIGGVDTSSLRERIVGVITVLAFKTLELVEISIALSEVNFPYIPGFLSFREGPVILKVWEKLKIKPDLLIFDGQGIAHPRRLGIASHVGCVLDVSSIGCAKNILVGFYKEPDKIKGSFEYIYHKGEIIGAAVRTKDNVKPVFVSLGHKVSLNTSIDIVLKTSTKYRIPEPVRLAHIYSKRVLNSEIEGKSF